MSLDAYHEALEKAYALSPKEQLRLIEDIARGLRQVVGNLPSQDNSEQDNTEKEE